jgi:hypothetical protein
MPSVINNICIGNLNDYIVENLYYESINQLNIIEKENSVSESVAYNTFILDLLDLFDLFDFLLIFLVLYVLFVLFLELCLVLAVVVVFIITRF